MDMATAGRQMSNAAKLVTAFALLLLSFAHQPVQARMNAVIGTDYVLPDGTIGDICFGSDGVAAADGKPAGGKRHGALAPVCEACRLSASLLVPLPADLSFLIVGEAVGACGFAAFSPLVVNHPHPVPPSHAPPVSL